MNSNLENIGARRLQTVIERVLDEISFSAPDRSGEKLVIDGKYVRDKVEDLAKKRRPVAVYFIINPSIVIPEARA